MTGILAKAARTSFGKHSGAGLFGEFESRKDHLHQETRVDKRGHTSRRWVSNEKKGGGKKKPSPAAAVLGLPTARGNMPALFAPEPTPAKKKARAPKPKAQPEAPLFGFDFGQGGAPTPQVSAPTPKPAAPQGGIHSVPDEALRAVLHLVDTRMCLANHGSYIADHIAPELGFDADTIGYAQVKADMEGLTKTEKKWTGSWRRVVLTPKGQKELRRLSVPKPVSNTSGVRFAYLDGKIEDMGVDENGHLFHPGDLINPRLADRRYKPVDGEPGAWKHQYGDHYSREDENRVLRPDPELTGRKAVPEGVPWQMGEYFLRAKGAKAVQPDGSFTSQQDVSTPPERRAEVLEALRAAGATITHPKGLGMAGTDEWHAELAAPSGRLTVRVEKPANAGSPGFRWMNLDWQPHAPDGSLPLSSEEVRALSAGALQVGSTKTEHGTTYRLNANHRWERVNDARPSVVRTKAGDLAITHGEDGRATVEGLSEGSHLAAQPDGSWHLHVGEGAQPIHLTHDGQGALSVTPPAPAPEPITTADFVAALKDAVQATRLDPTPEHEAELRAAIKNVKVATGQADENTPHTAATGEDTPPPPGQAYLVGLPEGVTDRQRHAWNDEAEALVMELRAHPRPTTPEERQLLARYSGNGGIGASLNEFYTPPELGEAMWDALRALGSGTGRGLEPSSGPGVLAQFAGEDARLDMVELSPVSAGIANALFGHRHDVHSMSYEAFRQRHPDASYDFLTGNPPFGPRDEHRFLDDRYQEITECSRYFMLSALDQLREGGIATLIVPAGLARNKSDADFRARVLARAQVVAIHGLPTDTFARAGTESATTDVWVLRGRPEALRGILDSAGEEGLKAAGLHDADFLAGRWHEAHPEQMHAEVTTRPGLHGIPVYARDGQLTPEVLAQVRATADVPPQTHPDPETLLEALKDNPRALAGWLKQQRGKEGETRTTATGQMQICLRGRWRNISDHTEGALRAAKQLGDLITLHHTVLSHGRHDEANGLRAQLERLLGEYKARYGNPHGDAELRRAAGDTPLINNLLAAFTPDGELADTLREDSAPQEQHVDPTDPASVLAHLRRQGAGAHLQNVMGVTGHATPDEAAEFLTGHGYAYHPEKGTWSAPGEFYSGDSNDVHALIDRGLSASQPGWARRALEAQREELQRRVPVVPLTEFEVAPRDSWVPLEVITNYLSSATDLYSHELDDWIERDEQGRFSVSVPTYNKYKAKQMNKLKRYLTGAGARSDEADDYEAWDEGFRDWLASQPHQREQVEQAYAARGAWLDPTWPTDPVDGLIPGWKAGADGGVDLHAFQNEAIHRSLAQGGGIIALDVGLGKTPTAIAHAFYAKHLGLARKPTAAVPKSVIGQWRQKALRYKPDARVLVVGAQQRLDAGGQPVYDERGQEVWDEVTGAAALDRQLSLMKTGDYDLVLMTHTTLGRIQYDPMQQLSLIQDEFYAQTEDKYGKPTGMSGKLYQEYAGLKAQAMIQAGELNLGDLDGVQDRLKELTLELREEFGGKRQLSSSEKKSKKKKQEERQRLVFLAAASRALSKDSGHPLESQWDELGIDHLVIDEAHNFKGLWTYSQGRGDKAVKYLGAPNEPSQRAVDLYYKTKAMREAQGGRGVYLLTATPIKNSPVELYNMLSYTAPQVFKRLGIHNLDQFVARYCRIEQTPSVDPDTGEITHVRVLAGLKNLNELRRECARFINRKTAEQVGLPLPFNDENVQHIEPRQEQADLIKWVALNPVEAALKYLGAEVPEGVSEGDEEYDKLAQRYALALPHITRRAELDMEMIDPEAHQGYVSPKVEALLTEMERAAKSGEKAVIFSDVVNMPNPGGAKPNPHGYTFHEKLQRLISERTGIPVEKIAIVNAQTCPDSEDRLRVSNGLKNGQYQVVIGNTGTMGEGINLQHGVKNLLHLDVPWNPAVWTQRVGRVVRQGNREQTVNNKTFLGTRGLDKDMYDTLKGKGVWYDEFWNGESDSLDADGQNDYRMTPERLAALALDDPAAREAALSKIVAEEAANRTLARRHMAVKLFRRYQSGRRALAEAEATVQRSKEPTERQKQAVADLKTSTATMRDKLSKNPAFADWTQHLDQPAGVVLDPASGRSFRQGDLHTVTWANDRQEHIVITGADPAKGKVAFQPVNLAGRAAGRDHRILPLSAMGQAQLDPYDPVRHLREHVASGGAIHTGYHEDADRLTRLLRDNPEAMRAGLREYDRRTPSSYKDRLVRRGGQIMLTSTDKVEDGDEYLASGDERDRQDIQAFIDAQPQNYRVRSALQEGHIDFRHETRPDYSTRYVVKAEQSSLTDLYTALRGK